MDAWSARWVRSFTTPAVTVLGELLVLAMLGSGPAAGAAAAAYSRPNVILLMSDDQGWGDVGYNNHTHRALDQLDPHWTPNAPRTPHLDEMARSNGSMVFWRWYAAATGTEGSAFFGKIYYVSVGRAMAIAICCI